MKKATLFSLGLLLSAPAAAVFGPEFLSSERPHSVCAIEYYRAGNLDEVCSAVMIGNKKLLTADHCVPGLPERDHKLICRGDNGVVISSITKVIRNEGADQERMIYDELARSHDNALIEIKDELSVPTLEFATTRPELLTIIANAQTCGIFGHGGFRHEIRKIGLSTNAMITPDQIVFDDDLIRVDGFKGRASGLVEPGDSGGSLACLDGRDKRWKHLGQTSARTMNGVSLFAPTYTISPQLKTLGITSIEPLYEEVRRNLKLADQRNEVLKCLDKNCRQEKIAVLKERVASGEILKVKVAPYSLIELDQTIDMIRLDGGRSAERFLTHPNPFTTVEGTYNRLTIKKIEGDEVVGDYQRYGYSEYFGCVENILCDGGHYLNVRVKLSDLLL